MADVGAGPATVSVGLATAPGIRPDCTVKDLNHRPDEHVLCAQVFLFGIQLSLAAHIRIWDYILKIISKSMLVGSFP